MRDDGPIERNLTLKQATFFRAAEKRGFTFAVIAAETDIPSSTLSSYVDKPSRKASLMPLAVFIKLAKIEGLIDLCSMLIEDSGHDLAPRDPDRADWLRIGERAAAFASKVCRFQSTGNRIDHVEDAELQDDIKIIIAEGHGALAGKS